MLCPSHMGMRLPCLPALVLVLLLPWSVQGQEQLENLNKQAVMSYQSSLEHLGLALGERPDEKDPARQAILAAIAEALCVLGDRDGCIDSSQAAGRSLGEHVPLLSQALAGKSTPASRSDGRRFVEELAQLSTGWGLDRSLALECLGLLARVEGDQLRLRVQKTGRAQLRSSVARARKSHRARDWLLAHRQASLLLDQRALARVSLELARFVNQGGQSAGRKRELATAVVAGQGAYAMLGQSRDPALKILAQALVRLKTKELSPSDLEFGLGPAVEDFQADLSRAQQELLSLAQLAEQRSRAAVLLHFFAAYAGMLIGQPDAADPLRHLGDTLAVSDPYLAGRAKGLLGRAALGQGDFHRASVLLDQAQEQLKSFRGNRALLGLLGATRARALFHLGYYNKSVAQYTRAAGQLEQHPAYALQAHLGRAQALLFAGDGPAAQDSLNQAQAILPRVAPARRPRLKLAIDLDRALAVLQSGERDQAIKALETLADKARSDSQIRLAVVARTNLAELFNDQRQPKKALSQAQAALKWVDSASQGDVAWQAWCEQGRALSALGEHRSAAQAFETAMLQVEQLRSQIPMEGARRSFSAAKQRLYAAAVAQLVAAGKPTRAFLVSERARGRAFLDMLGERQLHLADAGQQSRLNQLRRRKLSSTPPTRDPMALPGAVLVKPAAKSKKKTTPLADQDPRQSWLSLVMVNPASASDVGRVLGRGEGLLSFFHDGHQLHAFLVERNKVTLKSYKIEQSKLGNKVKDLLRVLRRPARTDSKVRQKSKRLYQICLGNLDRELSHLQRLVVVPWGPLHYVPFTSLFDGQRYLLDGYELSQVPSGSALVMIRSGKAYRRKLKNPRILALGNPKTELEDLPGASKEARLLGKLFARSRVLEGEKATKGEFVKRVAGRGLIHVASHGVFLPQRPMESYLALAGPTPESGRLPALEILGLDLGQSRLVMLSACSSGEVEVEQGDEIVGLSRAFLHAGAPALVASLWTLADESALHMVQKIYSGLQGGLRPSLALTRASRKLKADERFAHPFYWAAFSLIGS